MIFSEIKETTIQRENTAKYDRNRSILFRLKPFFKRCSWYYFLYGTIGVCVD